MRWFDLTLGSAAENVALDEALLLAAEAGEATEVLRFWEWPADAVILGAACKRSEDVNEAICVAEGVPLIRRSSGGGTVLLGRGCLCFSLVLAYARDERLNEIRSSYDAILCAIIEAFAIPGVTFEGICDLSHEGRKFSGNAQQRKRHHLLHHGTILYAYDLARIGHCLKLPVRQPEYREGRSHETFICNLNVERDWLVERIKVAFDARDEETSYPEERVRALMEEKYGRRDWHYRR